MNPKLKRFRDRLRTYVPGLFVFGKVLTLVFARRSFLRKSGYLTSVKTKRPCRRDGSPIPWMNYNVISFLEERLDRGLSLFEYGSGNSTLFFAKLVGSVVSVECDPAWYKEILANMPENVTLRLCVPYDAEKYVAMIGEQGQKFDVVVVDAEERPRCLDAAPAWLTDGGVILLDDADKEAYRQGIESLLDRGFRKLDFEGLKPGGIRAYRTTIFYRPENVLGI